MGLKFHPKQGSVVRVGFDAAFKAPEMVKPRLCVVVSKPIKPRAGLCTVVPLSTTTPNQPMPYHCQLDIAFELPPRWGRKPRWVKGDMIYAAGFHRIDLLVLGKDGTGKRIYQTETIPLDDLRRIQRCILNGLALTDLTKYI
ncbi:type II toxin-antitoxin system PemK/MazF family toxin [Roseovarius atlanticus]|uniref:type II toxin-antitoxin system PemK/MazF family toxin n=1 Tax=Roseovarius atlanticus TaxID=1641875 RepID=UPI0009E8EBAB|nr:type II toxin-antitoxin system PemK/MazF family toxin [Roseovarius atlanticus]